MTVTFLAAPPAGRQWFILDVMRKGNPARPFGRGRPANDWCALLIDAEPDTFCAGLITEPTQSCYLDLGRHRLRDDAWDHAKDMMATRH